MNGIGFAILTKRINERGWRPALPKSLYKSLKKLIRDCWHKDPNRRPMFDEIVKRLLNEVNIEIELKKEPIFTCDFEHPVKTTMTTMTTTLTNRAEIKTTTTTLTWSS